VYDKDEPWVIPIRGLIMGIERALTDAFERLSVYSTQAQAPRSEMVSSHYFWKIFGVKYGTYPGSFSVLFIEYAKCFPTEVKSSGR
jgi:hypothetical protein